MPGDRKAKVPKKVYDKSFGSNCIRSPFAVIMLEFLSVNG